MSYYNLLNLLTASDFISLNSAVSLNDAASLNDTASLSNTTGCNRLSSSLILLNRLTDFALLDNEGNYGTE